MNEDRYADRLGPDRYTDDPLVGVFDYDYSAPSEARVPERVWRRLQALGIGYELHHLSRIDGGSEPQVFNSVQAQALLEELEFVGGLVNDPLLISNLNAVLRVAASGSRGAGGGHNPALRIEGQ